MTIPIFTNALWAALGIDKSKARKFAFKQGCKGPKRNLHWELSDEAWMSYISVLARGESEWELKESLTLHKLMSAGHMQQKWQWNDFRN